MNPIKRLGMLTGLLLGLGLAITTSLIPQTNAQGQVPSSTAVFGEGNFLNRSTGSEDDMGSLVRDYTKGGAEGEVQIRNTIINAINFLKKLLIPITFVLFAWAGVELYLTHGNEEDLKNKKNMVIAASMGFAVILLAYTMVDNVFFGKEGKILIGDESASNAMAQVGVNEIKGIIAFLTTFAVAIAVAFVVIAAMKLIMGGENEEEIGNIKKQVIYACLGITAIMVASPVVEFIATENEIRTFDPAKMNTFYPTLVRYTNIILGFIGVIGVISLIYGGIRLILGFEDEQATEDAKNIVIYSVIAVVLAFSAFTITRFLITPPAVM